jgi:hypothetical protein
VTDAVGGFVRVRALVSAAVAPTDWDLRCLARERLVAWLRQNDPRALPRTRIDLGTERGVGRSAPPAATEGEPDHGATVFSGSVDGEERGATFAPRSDPLYRPDPPEAR